MEAGKSEKRSYYYKLDAELLEELWRNKPPELKKYGWFAKIMKLGLQKHKEQSEHIHEI